MKEVPVSEIILLLSTAPDIYGEATPFRQLMLKASANDLRRAIRECLLTPSSVSVNRRRMGLLADALLSRMMDAVSEKLAAEIRALDAEKKVEPLDSLLAELRGVDAYLRSVQEYEHGLMRDGKTPAKVVRHFIGEPPKTKSKKAPAAKRKR